MNTIYILISGCLLFPFVNGFIIHQLNTKKYFSNHFTRHQIALHLATTFFIWLTILMADLDFDSVSFGWNTMATTWLLIAGTIIIAINSCMVYYPQVTNKYRHLTHNKLPKWEWALHLLSWAIYLFFYEWLLRGLLLSLLIPILGFPVAIIFNVIIYAWMHLHKGWSEIWGSIPFGMLLCAGIYFTQTVWLAIFLHLLLAVSFESILLLKNNFHHPLNKSI